MHFDLGHDLGPNCLLALPCRTYCCSSSLTTEASARESLEHRMKLSSETHNEREPIRQRYATLVKVGWNRAATCIRDHE